jgi:transcriptional regulator GlxA family with amidase domain
MAEMPKNPRFPPMPPDARRSRTVDIVAFPAVQLLDVAGPLQVFATANELVAANGEAPLYAVRVVSTGAPNVVTSAGLGLAVAPLPRASTKLDTLLVAGGPGVHAAAENPKVLDWARQARAPRRLGLHRCVFARRCGSVE